MTITYEEALSTLQSMFAPQGYTQQQLDSVLRHFGGHMENCVDCILVHGEGSPDELIRKLSTLPAGGGVGGGAAARGNTNNDTISADEELARQLAAEDRRHSQTSYARTTTNNAAAAAARRQHLQAERRPMASTVTAPSSSSSPRRQQQQQPPAGTKGRGTLTILPADFLRIPGRNYSNNTVSSSTATANNTSSTNNNNAAPLVNSNGMTDEQLARMLQDELFQEELRNNPEFSHLSGGRYNTTGGRGRGAAGGGGGGQQQHQGPDFFDKLSELGDAAKNRFQAFAAGWNSQNSGGGGGGGLFGVGGGGGGNKSNATPSPRGNERRGLLSGDLDMDEDEEEMDFVGGGRDVELQSVGRSGDKKTD